MARIGMASVYSQGRNADPIYGMANQEAKAINKVFVLSGGGGSLDLGNVNEIKWCEVIPFKRWKIIALGMYWLEASTADEDPIVEFGRTGSAIAFGKMTSAITGGEKFNLYDHQKYDPLGLLAPEVITETSATLAVTWTMGTEFNVWSEVASNLRATEAAVAGMTSGKIRPYFVIEVDTGGKW